jgi:uncharacterized membrane protein
MRSRFKVLGHPLHPILIVFPLGLYPIALISDLIFIGRFLWDGTIDGFWWGMAFWTLIFGTLMTLGAALPGLIDWLNIPGDAPSKRPATFHLIIGVFFIVPLTLGSILLRNWGTAPTTLNFGGGTSVFYVAIAINLFMNVLLGFQGWLGGHLVYVHGIGVESSDKIDPIATQVNEEVSREARRAGV